MAKEREKQKITVTQYYSNNCHRQDLLMDTKFVGESWRRSMLCTVLKYLPNILINYKENSDFAWRHLVDTTLASAQGQHH